MTAPSLARYHLPVGLGKAALRIRRWQAERKAISAKGWKSQALTPPLKISPYTKELVARHYLEGRYANQGRKVAWVTSGAPVELLKALDFYVLYPENHAAVCGAARLAEYLAVQAENAGYSRDICSYARTDLGALICGRTPVGSLPRPDLLFACTNICQTVLAWYRVLADHYGAPLIVIDTPFIYQKPGEHALGYVQRQCEAAIPLAEQVAGKKLAENRLRETIQHSRTASQLWMEILESARNHPAPISVFDQFIHMAPIVEMRGDPQTVDFYAAMLREVHERIANGIGTVKREQKRLLWDNLPIWYRLRSLAEMLGERGVALIASSYTNAWGELAEMIDPHKPFESMARVYLHPILNQGAGHKLTTLQRMVTKYQLDGVLLHSDRSCKPYSIGQMDQRERLSKEFGIPALLLDADHNDPRAYSDEQVATRLGAFMEILGV
jgi:benzoyl-CoA reductase/2-hydroxyglutaryl-CoA dehydratase subunit BcrC/BadD/HgdB